MTENPTKRPTAMAGIQSKIILGILTLLPLAVVWFVLSFLIDLLSWMGRPVIDAVFTYSGLQDRDRFGWLSNEVLQTSLAVILAIWIIYIVGAVASNMIGARVLAVFDRILNRVPLVRQIYGAAQKLVQSLGSKPDGIQRVVLLPFPNADMRAIGFVTKTFTDAGTGLEYAAVYVPTSPNPTSGYLEIILLEKCIETDFSMDQAMNMILSGGATAPDQVRFGPPSP